MNGKKYIATEDGVRITHDKSAEQFIPTRSFDYDSILGLDKPKVRVKARISHWDSPQNCHVVHKTKIVGLCNII